MLPAGVIEQMINLKEEETKATMNELWMILVNRVKKRNESKIELVEDECVMNALEELKDLRKHVTKMGNLLSKESKDKIKKRKHRDFCVWERQTKNDHRREKKTREREKGAMDKCLGKKEETHEIGTNQITPDIYNMEYEETDMIIAVGEEMNRVFGELGG